VGLQRGGVGEAVAGLLMSRLCSAKPLCVRISLMRDHDGTLSGFTYGDDGAGFPPSQSQSSAAVLREMRARFDSMRIHSRVIGQEALELFVDGGPLRLRPSTVVIRGSGVRVEATGFLRSRQAFARPSDELEALSNLIKRLSVFHHASRFLLHETTATGRLEALFPSAVCSNSAASHVCALTGSTHVVFDKDPSESLSSAATRVFGRQMVELCKDVSFDDDDGIAVDGLLSPPESSQSLAFDGLQCLYISAAGVTGEDVRLVTDPANFLIKVLNLPSSCHLMSSVTMPMCGARSW
jgi:hypothetical protein